MQATSAVGQTPFRFFHLPAHFLADDGLEVAHQRRVRMRAGDGADDVEGALDIRDPVAQRLVHRVLQRARAGLHRHHLGAEQLHAEHVGLLARDVDFAHVDGAGQVEQRAHRGGRDAMLAGAGLGDDPLLAHALGEQDLAHAVVDLVRAGVVELVALQVDLGAAETLGQARREIERAGPADIMLAVILHLVRELGVSLGGPVGLLHLEDQRHQRFGDEAAAEHAEAPELVGAIAIAVARSGSGGGQSGFPGVSMASRNQP